MLKTKIIVAVIVGLVSLLAMFQGVSACPDGATPTPSSPQTTEVPLSTPEFPLPTQEYLPSPTEPLTKINTAATGSNQEINYADTVTDYPPLSLDQYCNILSGRSLRDILASYTPPYILRLVRLRCHALGIPAEYCSAWGACSLSSAPLTALFRLEQ
jgi:hypothetical protein